MKQFFKDFMIYGFASILGKIAGILLMPVYTSILPREEYGVMALLTSLNGVLGLLANLNIHSGIARDYYEEGIDRKSLVSTGFWSISVLALLVMAIMIITRSYWLHDVLSVPDHDLCFLLVLFEIPASNLSAYFAIMTRYKKKPILFSIGSLIQLAIQLSVSIIGVVVLHSGIIAIILGSLLSSFFALIYFMLLNQDLLSFNFNWHYLKRSLLFGLPTLPAILAGWADGSIGQIFIGRNVSLTDLGVYSIALSFVSIMTLISTALQNVWGPFLYENYRKPTFIKEADRLFTTFILLLTFVAGTVSIMSKELILIFSNPNYLDARLYLTLLFIPHGVYLLFPFASSGVGISRKTYYTAIAYITGSVLNILIIILFIKKIGIYAIPIGLAISRIVAFIMQAFFSRKIVRISFYKILIYVGLVIGCFVVVWKDLSLTYRIFLTLILWGGLTLVAVKKYDALNVIKSSIKYRQN